MFGPDKEYCQHFADTASAGRIKLTLFCSVCGKLKASQFICSRPRLTGASYSHRITAEMWRQENKREFPLAQETLLSVCSRLHSDGERNVRSRLAASDEVESSSDSTDSLFSPQLSPAVIVASHLCMRKAVFCMP